MIAKNKRLLYLLSPIPFLLMIPLIAMQFTTEVNWGVADFLIAGMLLVGTGLLAEFILRKITKPSTRIALLVLLVVGFLLVWAELGVGIFGTPFAGS